MSIAIDDDWWPESMWINPPRLPNIAFDFTLPPDPGPTYGATAIAPEKPAPNIFDPIPFSRLQSYFRRQKPVW